MPEQLEPPISATDMEKLLGIPVVETGQQPHARPIMTFDYVSDEECLISIGEAEIIRASHEDHAWQGVKDIVRAMEKVSQVMGLRRVVKGRPIV